MCIFYLLLVPLLNYLGWELRGAREPRPLVFPPERLLFAEKKNTTLFLEMLLLPQWGGLPARLAGSPPVFTCGAQRWWAVSSTVLFPAGLGGLALLGWLLSLPTL